MICLAPRALEESVRPRRLADVIRRPLNFTVRTPMSGYWPIIYFGAVAVVALGINGWGTRVLLRQSDLPPLQRRWQLVLIWVVPVIGALLVIEMYRPTRWRRSKFLTADEVNPMLNQALQPLAKDATRAAEGFIEQEVFEAIQHHFADSGGGDAGAGHGGSH